MKFPTSFPSVLRILRLSTHKWVNVMICGMLIRLWVVPKSALLIGDPVWHKDFSQSTKWALMGVTLGPYWLKKKTKEKTHIIETGKLDWTFSNSVALLYFILLGETRLPSGFLSIFLPEVVVTTPTCSCMHLKLVKTCEVSAPRKDQTRCENTVFQFGKWCLNEVFIIQ